MAQHTTHQLSLPYDQTLTRNDGEASVDNRRTPPGKITRQNAISSSDDPCVNIAKTPELVHQLSVPTERLVSNYKEGISSPPAPLQLCGILKDSKKVIKKHVSIVEPTPEDVTDVIISVPSPVPSKNSQFQVPKTERCKTAHVKLSSQPSQASSSTSNEKTKVTKRKKSVKSSGHAPERRSRLRRASSAVESSSHSKGKKHKLVRQQSVPASANNKKASNSTRRILQKQLSLPSPASGKLTSTSSNQMRNDPKKSNAALASKVHHPNKKELLVSAEAAGAGEVADRQKRRSLSAVNNAAHDNSLLSKRINSAVSGTQLNRQNSVPANPARNNLRFLKQESLPSAAVGGFLADGSKRSNGARAVLSPVVNGLYRPNKEKKTVNFSDAIAFPEVATIISEVSPVPSDVENTDSGSSWAVQISGRTKTRSASHAPAFLNRTYSQPRSRPNSGKVQEKCSPNKGEDTPKKQSMPIISSTTKKQESKEKTSKKDMGAATTSTATLPNCDDESKVDHDQQIIAQDDKTEISNQPPNDKSKERKVLGIKSSPIKTETMMERKLTKANTAPEVPVQEENVPPASPIIHHLGTETECLALHKKLINHGLEVPLGKLKRALMTPTEYRLLHARGTNSARQ